MRAGSLFVLAAVVAPLGAQGVTGTWSLQGGKGAITLTLKGGESGVNGTLSGAGTTYQLRGQVDASGTFTGEATGGGMRSYVEAMARGDQLVLVMAEFGADGVPQPATARQLMFSRAAGGGSLLGTAVPKGSRSATDPFAGRFASDQVVVTLEREGQGYRGTFQRAGQEAPLQARTAGKGLSGTIQDNNGATYLFLITPEPRGIQLEISGRKFSLQREEGTRTTQGNDVQGAGGAAGGPAGGPGSIGRSAQDQQLAQLLLSGRWCHFSYKSTGGGGSGRSYQETVTFGRDGLMTVDTGGETYSSGTGGTYAGQGSGGQRFYWRIQGGMLHLSSDGATWQPMPMQVKTNSNGWPIITGDGKEYSRCN